MGSGAAAAAGDLGVTALCGGGASGPRPGYNTVVGLTAAAVTAAIDLWTESPIGDLVGGLIAGVAVDLSTLCSTDPPPAVTLQPSDITDALNFADSAVSDAAIERLRQWFVHNYWYMACGCLTAPTPPMPTTSLPTGIGVNDGIPNSNAAPCYSNSIGSDGVSKLDDGVRSDFFIDWNDLLPGSQTVHVDPLDIRLPYSVAKILPNPLVSTTVHWTGSFNSNFNGIFVRVEFFDVNGHNIGGGFSSAHPGPTWDVTSTFGVPTGAVSWCALLDIGEAGSDVGQPYTCTLSLEYTCGTLNTPTTPCCPPNTATDIRLQQIVGLLNQLMAGSQGGPVEHLVDGTAHRALSGNGTVTLSASVPAIRVAVNPPLPGWPNNPGSPNYYFSMGFITSIAVGSPLKGWRLVYQGQMFPLEPYADQVGYTLPPGVQVDIIEQLPAGA